MGRGGELVISGNKTFLLTSFLCYKFLVGNVLHIVDGLRPAAL